MKSMGYVIIVLLYLLGNYYVFHHLWVAMPPNLVGRISIVSFAVIAVFSFFVVFLFGNSMPIGLTRFLYTVGTSWLFIMLYFFIFFLVNDLIGVSNRFLHFMPSDAITRYTKDNWVGLTFMVGFITMLMICGYLKYTWKVRVDVPIQLSKTLSHRDSLKIVAISDLHLGYGIGKKEFEGWIEKINNENPDIVIIGGDIIDSSVRPLIADDVASSFHKIKAPLGIYACLGNHEYLSGSSESMNFIKQTGVNLLKDMVAEIDSTFYIIGRDDKMNPKRKSLEQLTEGLDKTKPIILLDHQPFHLEDAENNGIDLQFSGHTHRGQVWPISLVTDAIYEVSHGYKQKGDTHVIVSSGIGIWGGKFRIGTQSEYVVITLKGKDK